MGTQPNALVQLQAQYNHCGEAASEKCLSAATFVRPRETKEWLTAYRLGSEAPSARTFLR
jgi:hypothetical protein